jgi:ATP-dependent helicase/nuclease subunit A
VIFPVVNIRVRAGKSLKNILHDYSSFSVSTIDSFFQRILRALAREIHLPLKMEVEVSADDAILAVTDSILREVGSDKDLTEWLTDLALQKMSEDKGWNIENDIALVAGELFKEDHHNKKILSRDDIKRIYKDLSNIRRTFTSKLKKIGEEGLKYYFGSRVFTGRFLLQRSWCGRIFFKNCQSKKCCLISGHFKNRKRITRPFKLDLQKK